MIAGANIGHACANGIDTARNLQPDSARKIPSKQAPAKRPIGRVEPTGVHEDPDATGTWAGYRRVIQPQHVCRFAIAIESYGSHGGIGVSAIRMPII